MKNCFKIKFVLFFAALILSGPSVVFADSLGENVDFYIASSFDSAEREKISASLQVKSDQLYFYVDNAWWEQLQNGSRDELKSSLSSLCQEFDDKIYPILTSTYGSEWNPGIDNDERITVLLHQMQESAGGYIRTEDEYPKEQAPHSNLREMIYLNASYITSSIAKSFLAHEFTHLIVFNQKDKIHGVTEDTWLNEARADYAPARVGYDDEYLGSNLQQRISIFLDYPSDPLIEWTNQKKDYGALNLFIQYLVDHYGVEVLVNSLHSKKTGVVSLNEALQNQGYARDFSQIFIDWTIAVLVNDCELGEKYCYKNENLEDLRIAPQINFLPYADQASLSRTDSIKEWSGNWYKISGGKNALKFKFTANSDVQFKVPYIISENSQAKEIGLLEFNHNKEALLYIPDFRAKNKSLIIIPSVNGDTEESHQFSFVASVIEKTPEQEQESEAELIIQLKAMIQELLKEIAQIQAQIKALQQQHVCGKLETNLYYGMQNNAQVSCLQEFLKAQGTEIYPEGIVSGWFGPLTKQAIIRFQEKYVDEILAEHGLISGTGFVGRTTRAKINSLLEK
ncbi:hypothetical protein KAR26_02625 [Candidatus Parcubacteria bacterium]|nr:hypothetical protein [Candidatus Parcubacteria bacterium]